MRYISSHSSISLFVSLSPSNYLARVRGASAAPGSTQDTEAASASLFRKGIRRGPQAQPSGPTVPPSGATSQPRIQLTGGPALKGGAPGMQRGPKAEPNRSKDPNEANTQDVEATWAKPIQARVPRMRCQRPPNPAPRNRNSGAVATSPPWMQRHGDDGGGGNAAFSGTNRPELGWQLGYLPRGPTAKPPRPTQAVSWSHGLPATDSATRRLRPLLTYSNSCNIVTSWIF